MSQPDGNIYLASEEVRKNFIKSALLIGIIVALILVVCHFIGQLLESPATGYIIGGAVVLVVIPIQVLLSRYAILGMSRGRPANPDDLRERRAQHLVEGLAIAAGLSRTPDLYIIPSSVPNAFASGLSEKDAFVAVTQGLLDLMDEQQLEGVLAHEISHIIHRDILLNQLVIALISALLLLAFILERVSLYSGLGGRRRSNDRGGGGGGAILLFLVLLALLVRPLAQLIGALLQLGISRQREYAADAMAVRLCSYNEGLASALEKLGGKPLSKEDVESLGGKELAAMYINFPGAELFSTHPPIEKRVAKLRQMY